MNRHLFADAIQRIAKGEVKYVLTCFVIIFAFYYFSAAGNLSETDDVYAFAYRAENFPFTHISDPRLMLYHMAMRALYLAGAVFSKDISAVIVMRLFSVICAALSLVMVIRILIRDFNVSSFTAGTTTIVLGLTYGFWRYAAEAEVYIPAILLCLLIFHLLSQSLHSCQSFEFSLVMKIKAAAIGALSGCAVLFYQPNIIPLFFAFPLLLLSKNYIRSMKLLSLYILSGVIFIVAGYVAGYLLFWEDPLSLHSFTQFLSQRTQEFIVPSLSVKIVIVSLVRSAFSLSHDLVSANWIFGFNGFVQLIERAFSNNVIVEEVFLAQRAGWIKYLPLIVLPLLLIQFVRLCISAWPLNIKTFVNLKIGAIVLWLMIYGAVVGRLNPAGIEAWIMVLPPLVILAGIIIIERCVAKQKQVMLITFAVLLLIHNAFGGMGLVINPDHEYDRVKGAWVISQATENDLVIVTGNAGLAESMRYLSDSKVALISSRSATPLADALINKQLPGRAIFTYGRDFSGHSIAQLIDQAAKNNGRVIFFEEFFSVNNQWPINFLRNQDVLRGLQQKLPVVQYSPEVGSTYAISANALSLQ